jgi:hypothetical protein
MPRLFIASALIALLTGCSAAYHAPGGAADFRALGITPEAQKAGTAVDIQAAFDKKPLAAFPANVAVVRIQQPGYRSETVHASHGSGAFSVVTARDVESEDAIDRLRKLPQVRGIAPLGRMLMPSHFNSDRDLRAAAAQLQCDLLLVYTFDTAFQDRDLATPISVITLGLAPTQATQVTTTASAVLFDTRNGYVYGLAEAHRQPQGHRHRLEYQRRHRRRPPQDGGRSLRQTRRKSGDDVEGRRQRSRPGRAPWDEVRHRAVAT